MSIADRISSMASNLSSAYGRIAYLGVNTTSIDKNMQNLSTVLDTVYNDYPKVSDEGISPSLSGTKVGRLSSTLKGNTSQDGTPTPNSPVDINVVKGENSVTVSDGDSESETYPITLPTGMELCKIRNYQDYIYRENRNWYKYNAVGKVVLDGSEEGWVYGATISRFGISQLIQDYSINNRTYSICTHYTYGDTTLNGFFALSGSNNVLYMYQPNDNINTVPLFQAWLSAHRPKIYYPLATPTTTQITDTTLISQLNALYNAMSYNGETNILQTNADLPFIISASALKAS